MRESKPPLPWVATGVKDAEKCINISYNQLTIQRHMIKNRKKIKLLDLNLNSKKIEIIQNILKNYIIKTLKILKLQSMKERKKIIFEYIN